MKTDPFENVLSQLYTARPFQIFSIVLNNGENFQVDSPMALSYRDGYGVFIAPGGQIKYFDSRSVLKMERDPSPVI